MRNHYVDFDTHVYDPITIWRDYLDPQFRDRSPQWIERDGRLMVDVAGKTFPSAISVTRMPSFGSICRRLSRFAS